MREKIKPWLQIKVFAALAVLLIGAAAIVAYLNLLARDNYANQELLSILRQVEVQGQAIKRRAITYAEHAPRDYAPYDRDLVIFYPDFLRDLDAYDQQLTNLAKASMVLPEGLFHSDKEVIRSSIVVLQSQWQEFRTGLQDKLGDDAAEPRLEWGAEYVQQHQTQINDIAIMLTHSIDMAIQDQLASNSRLSKLATSAAAVLLLLGVIWFYLRVVRRIILTVHGCQRVAQGDFGYQLPSNSNDELGALARAFNLLSSRTLFVLNMLSKMHRHGNAESKVDALWQEANSYLPIQWLGLWQFHPQDRSMELLSMRSNRSIRGSMQQDLIKAATRDPHLLGLLTRGAPIKYDDLDDVVAGLPTARLFREFLKLGLLKSALLVPLKADDGWQGLLLFIASDNAAYTQDQLELMGNMAPFIANGFGQAVKSNH